MGGLTSKYLEEMMHTPPRTTHVLRTDPRSPSDNISRTPISVTDTPERSNGGTPAAKVLPFDPRSPSVEVNRTPIMVEAKESRRRPFSLKPSRLIDPNTLTNTDDLDLDPRSPTSRVPRTPLSDQTHSFTNKEVGEHRVSAIEETQEGKKEGQKDIEEEEVEEKDDGQDSSISSSTSNDENKEVTLDAPKEKEYLDLGGGNKRSSKNGSDPRSMLQSKQCQAIEAEYSKNQHTIFTQLTEEEKNTTLPSNTTLSSNTQFVENI